MELLVADRARAAVRDASVRDGAALGSTFGYLPEPQRELAAPAPPAGTTEIVTERPRSITRTRGRDSSSPRSA